MLYRNRREYEQTLKNLENALHEGAQKAKNEPKARTPPEDGTR